jgi:dTDP-4-dehydrorhamnose reductase
VRILVIGGDGMLGHQLVRSLSARHEVAATTRAEGPGSFAGVEVRSPATVARAIDAARPDAVVNAVGLVKQRPEAADTAAAIEVNALFPHRLAALCRERSARLVHISTDCVFSGRRGGYREEDEPDPVDTYDRTKLLGEVTAAPAVTLRTSLVGLEKRRASGLVEWFLSQRGDVPGYTRALFSGLTTAEASRVVALVLESGRPASGLWHVASAPISKADLLRGLLSRLRRADLRVVEDPSVVLDRTLDGRRFAAETGYRAPEWSGMLTELSAEIRERQGRIE